MTDFTKDEIAKLRPEPGKEIFLWDAKETGFGVRAYNSIKSGKVLLSYVIQYREPNDNRKTRRMKIGTDRLSIAQARNKAKALLTSVELGENPVEKRQARGKAPTLKDLMDRYLDEYAKEHKKASSVKTDKINIRCQILAHIKPSKKVADVGRKDVDRMRANLKATPGAFNRARAVLSKAMGLAEEWELRPQNSNPCRYVKEYKLESRERFLSSTEFAALGEALAESQRTATESPLSIAAIRLLIFLGARRGEILNLKWEEVDMERGIIMLPDSKTGKKPLFLNPPAIEVINGLKSVKNNPYVIPGEKEGQPLYDLKGPWNRIRKAAGLEGVRIHDLRHSFASVGAMGGAPLQMISKMLGHANIATTEKYSHLANDPVRAANDAIGNQIAAAMNSSKETAEIIDPSSKKGA